MKEDLWKIVGILIIGIIIVYTLVSMFTIKPRILEGLDNPSTSSSSTSTNNGEAAMASSFAAAIKAQAVQIQDALLISKYRKDYENVIINMDDYLSMLMLQTITNINVTADVPTICKSLNQLNTLSTAKKSLNETMVFVDKQ